MLPDEVFRLVCACVPRARRQRIDTFGLVEVTPFFRGFINGFDDPNGPDIVGRLVDDFVARMPTPDWDGRGMSARLRRLNLEIMRHRPGEQAALDTLISEVLGMDAAAAVSNQTFTDALAEARDAVVALKVRPDGKRNGLADYARIVQAGALVQRAAREPDTLEFPDIAAMLMAPIRLPEGFEAIIPRANTDIDTSDNEQTRDTSAVRTRLKRLERAILEISEGSRDLDRRDADEEVPQRTRLTLSATSRSRLSESTRGFLADEQIDVSESAFVAVLDALESRRSALVTELVDDEGDEDEAIPVRFFTGATVLPSTSTSPVLPLDPAFLDPTTLPPTTVGPLRPTRVGRLLKVRQQLKRYEAGAISHTQNVLRSEHLTRSTRRLRRTEESLLIEEETKKEEERTLQSTDRFEMQSEIKNTLANARQFNVGVDVSAGYGPFVQVDASTAFQTSSSSEQVEASATSFARDVTETTAARVSERVRTEVTRSTLEEFEENNSQGFDNRNGLDHAIGIYQWLDKVYELQLYDYGARLLFEFTVLEPAALYLNALESQIAKPEGLKAPQKLSIKPNQITASNYASWVAKYRADGVTAPPPVHVTVAKSFSHASADGSTAEHASEAMLIVPEGYRAVEARATIRINDPSPPALPGGSAGDNRVEVAVADRFMFREQSSGQSDLTDLIDSLDHAEGDLPVAVHALNVVSYVATVSVVCVRTARAYEQWQLSTYDALARAYEARRAEYEERLATIAAGQSAQPIGRNPQMNRIIEHNEFKRLAIMMFTGQRFKSTAVPLSPQGAEFDFDRMLRSGQYANFWEHVIEWDKMDVELHPYYWARQSTWARLLTEDTDPLHGMFISAGAATVRLSVVPGAEARLLNFLETGATPDDQDAPEVTTDAYLDFLDEIAIQRREDVRPGQPPAPGVVPPREVAIGKPWEIRLPTTLVSLRPDASLPEWERDDDGQWRAVEPGT